MTTKILPAHWETSVERIHKGRCVPFLGCRSRKPELTTILDFFFCSPHPGRVVAAPDDALQEVCDATPCHLCPARLRGHLVQVKRLTAPGKPGVTAPTGRLQTARATPAASSIRSRVLGLAGTPVVRLASRPDVCPAPHRHRLAAKALPRPLAASQPAGHAWSTRHYQRGPGPDSGYVAGESHVGIAADRGRAP